MAVAGATVLALGLALYRLGTLSFWVDEGATDGVTGGSWKQVAAYSLWGEPNFGLYYVGLKAWTVVGRGETAFRFPSALFAAATVPLVAALAARLAGSRAGVIAAVLSAVHASLLRWAQEARPYAMAVFLVTLSGFLLVRACDRPSRARWTVWAIVAALSCYAHTFGAVAVAAQAGAGLIRGSRRRPLLVASLAVLAVATPLVVLTLASGTTRISWLPPLDGDEVAFALMKISGGAGTLLAVAYATAALAGIVLIRGSDRVFVAAWWAAPVVFAIVASLRQPLLQDRYLLVSVPPLTIGAAAGLARMQPTALAAAAVAGFVALSLTGVADWYSGGTKEDWRSAVRTVASRAHDSDVVLVEDGYDVFGYYYRRAHAPHLEVLRIGAPDVAARMRGAPRRWLVLRELSEKRDEGSQLAAAGGRRIAGVWQPNLLRVELYARS